MAFIDDYSTPSSCQCQRQRQLHLLLAHGARRYPGSLGHGVWIGHWLGIKLMPSIRLGREPAPMSADCNELIERGEASVLRPRGLEEVYGVLVVRVDKNALWIESVATRISAPRLGRRLLHFAQQQARKIGMLEVRLYQRTDDREPGALGLLGSPLP